MALPIGVGLFKLGKLSPCWPLNNLVVDRIVVRLNAPQFKANLAPTLDRRLPVQSFRFDAKVPLTKSRR